VVESGESSPHWRPGLLRWSGGACTALTLHGAPRRPGVLDESENR
jgi:hypothetical protein